MIVDEIFDDGQACDATALENFKRVANDIYKFLRGQEQILIATDEEVKEFLEAKGFEVVSLT